MKIFLLEDDESIAFGLRFCLESEGFSVTVSKTIEDAKAVLSKESFALHLLDLTLPDGSGYEVCKIVKEKSDAPVIFLTAFDDEVNVVTAFELGADDYIAKPFRIKELLARIKSVLRRCNRSENTDFVVRLGNVTVNTKTAEVSKNGMPVILTAMEYRLLLTLINNRGAVLSRNKLLEEIWDVEGNFVNDNTLTVYMKRLRDKIEDDPTNPTIIKTVRGMGYKL